MEEIKITIVGAGVIGLAVGFELSGAYKDIFILEKNHSFGQETSSRNSEVIHAGIYYPPGSLKARTCLEGRRLLYEFCEDFSIAHKKTGKLIVAVNQNEVNTLAGIIKNAQNCGVEGLLLLDKKEVKEMEPNLAARAAIYSPDTGILDTHGLMKTLSSNFTSAGGQIAYNTQLSGIEKQRDKFSVTVRDKLEGEFSFRTEVIINCAGLASDKIAGLAGISRDDYRIKYCKGDYFRVVAAKCGLVSRLIYPVPKSKSAGLGIHVTPDLAGSLRLGPDDYYIDDIDYDIDRSKRAEFSESIGAFLPFIGPQDLSPDISGIRPKLQGPGENFRDFIIKDEAESGSPGLINLIGIESPGLTASLSIAKEVRKIILDKI